MSDNDSADKKIDNDKDTQMEVGNANSDGVLDDDYFSIIKRRLSKSFSDNSDGDFGVINRGIHVSGAPNRNKSLYSTVSSVGNVVGGERVSINDKGMNSADFISQQISELNVKHADIYVTLNEVRGWVAESKIQSDTIQRQMDGITDKNVRVSTELEALKEVTKNTKSEFDDQVEQFKSDIVASRNSVLGMIALFASFFSFISVSISIFSKSMPLSLSISIVLVLWICLVSFLYIFMVSLNSGVSFFTKKSFFEHFVVVAISLVFAMTVPYVIIDKVFKVEPVHYFNNDGTSNKGNKT